MESTPESRAFTLATTKNMLNGKVYTNRSYDSSNRYEHQDYISEYNDRTCGLTDARPQEHTMQAVKQTNIDDLYRMMQRLGRSIDDLSLQVRDMEYRNDGYINSKLTRLHEKIDSLIILEPLE